MLFAVFGYLFFGRDTQSVITKNLNPGALADSVRVTLSISLFFTYAIQLFPGTSSVD
jgi:proton-coupled amino acid transporter